MSDRKVRIGIDVGGTFTDAVVIDNSTYRILAKAKIPTTHHAEEGVAKGIVEVIEKVLKENSIKPQDVAFIAHGTTQATNALLEGDVAKVGIIGMGSGFEGERAKSETKVEGIELAPGKILHSVHSYLDTGRVDESIVKRTVENLRDDGAQVIVASEAYSVDNPENEMEVIRIAGEQGLPATGGYEISQLYGLQARTRTAVVNAALIPKMVETANMTEQSVRKAAIEKPLMIMRCDGGVMSVDEVRKRPILTMLSGLAAGVAGALMYEKVTDGIFFEVGGTSTDISVIKDGKVMIKNAEVGGRKLYLTSLDVRTLGIAGGSMIVIENGAVTDVGPRSAHIADKEYEVFAESGDMTDPVLELIAPRTDDKPDYAVVTCSNGRSYALTLAGAANILGYVPEGDYASGNVEAARKAWQAAADAVGTGVEDLCGKVMDIAAEKIKRIVDSLIRDYELNTNVIHFIGGGGSASVITPYVGEKMGIRVRIAENAPYISTIGVALAMVRESVERNVANPSKEDIRRIRHDVTEKVVKAGADPATVDISVEVDAQKNILRATATGATELRVKDPGQRKKSESELENIVRESVGSGLKAVQLEQHTGRWYVYTGIQESKRLFGIIKSRKKVVRVIDDEGVIRLQRESGRTYSFARNNINKGFSDFIDDNTLYSDAGATLPAVWLYFGQKSVDLSGILNKEQLISLVEMELEFVDDDTRIVAVATHE